MTGKAKAVNWVSSLADALNGAAAEEMYAGTIRTEAHGTVQVDGTVRTGIMRNWSLTLDNWDRSTGTITASGKVNAADQKIGFTVTQEALQSSLVTELENARAQLSLYQDSNQTLINYYQSEVARLEAALAQGLLEAVEGTGGVRAGPAVRHDRPPGPGLGRSRAHRHAGRPAQGLGDFRCAGGCERQDPQPHAGLHAGPWDHHPGEQRGALLQRRGGDPEQLIDNSMINERNEAAAATDNANNVGETLRKP